VSLERSEVTPHIYESEYDRIIRDTFSVKEVAERLGVGPVTVRKMCQDPYFPAVKAGRGYRISKVGYDKWLADGMPTVKKEAGKNVRNQTWR